MIVSSPEYVASRYQLKQLKELEDIVAESVEINIPFNNPITGFCAFTHKAGIHAKVGPHSHITSYRTSKLIHKKTGNLEQPLYIWNSEARGFRTKSLRLVYEQTHRA